MFKEANSLNHYLQAIYDIQVTLYRLLLI